MSKSQSPSQSDYPFALSQYTGAQSMYTQPRGNQSSQSELAERHQSSTTSSSSGSGGSSPWASAFAHFGAYIAELSAMSPDEQQSLRLRSRAAGLDELSDREKETELQDLAAQLNGLVQDKTPEEQAKILEDNQSVLSAIGSNVKVLGSKETDSVFTSLNRMANQVGLDNITLITGPLASGLDDAQISRFHSSSAHIRGALEDVIAEEGGALLGASLSNELEKIGASSLAETVAQGTSKGIDKVRADYEEALADSQRTTAEIYMEARKFQGVYSQDALENGISNFMEQDDVAEVFAREDEMTQRMLATMEGVAFARLHDVGRQDTLDKALEQLPNIAAHPMGGAILEDALHKTTAGDGTFFDMLSELNASGVLDETLNQSLRDTQRNILLNSSSHLNPNKDPIDTLESTLRAAENIGDEELVSNLTVMQEMYERLQRELEDDASADEFATEFDNRWTSFCAGELKEGSAIKGMFEAYGFAISTQSLVQSSSQFVSDPSLDNGVDFTQNATGIISSGASHYLQANAPIGDIPTQQSIDDIGKRAGRINLAASTYNWIKDPISFQNTLGLGQSGLDVGANLDWTKLSQSRLFQSNRAGNLMSRIGSKSAGLKTAAARAGTFVTVALSTWDIGSKLHEGDELGAALSTLPLIGMALGSLLGPLGSFAGSLIGTGLMFLGEYLRDVFTDEAHNHEKKMHSFHEGAVESMLKDSGLSEEQIHDAAYRIRDVNDDFIGVGPIIPSIAARLNQDAEDFTSWMIRLPDEELHRFVKEILDVDIDSNAVNEFLDEGNSGRLPNDSFEEYAQLGSLAQRARDLQAEYPDAAPDVLPDSSRPWSEGPQYYTS